MDGKEQDVQFDQQLAALMAEMFGPTDDYTARGLAAITRAREAVNAFGGRENEPTVGVLEVASALNSWREAARQEMQKVAEGAIRVCLSRSASLMDHSKNTFGSLEAGKCARAIALSLPPALRVDVNAIDNEVWEDLRRGSQPVAPVMPSPLGEKRWILVLDHSQKQERADHFHSCAATMAEARDALASIVWPASIVVAVPYSRVLEAEKAQHYAEQREAIAMQRIRDAGKLIAEVNAEKPDNAVGAFTEFEYWRKKYERLALLVQGVEVPA